MRIRSQTIVIAVVVVVVVDVKSVSKVGNQLSTSSKLHVRSINTEKALVASPRAKHLLVVQVSQIRANIRSELK